MGGGKGFMRKEEFLEKILGEGEMSTLSAGFPVTGDSYAIRTNAY